MSTEASFRVSLVVFPGRPLSGLDFLFVVARWCCCLVLVCCFFFCFALKGPSGHKTVESTNDSLSRFAESATIQWMSSYIALPPQLRWRWSAVFLGLDLSAVSRSEIKIVFCTSIASLDLKAR